MAKRNTEDNFNFSEWRTIDFFGEDLFVLAPLLP